MKPWQAIVAIALALITVGERLIEERSQSAEAAAHIEEVHALEIAFRHQAEANQQVVRGLMGLLWEGRADDR